MGLRIQQAIIAEGKSPACEASAWQRRLCRDFADPARKKTRPSAQYNANDLASPGH
jgi:hypothetical protein